MRMLVIITALVLSAAPGIAQENSQDDSQEEILRELDEFSKATRKFLESWIESIEPSLEYFKDTIGDLSLYQQPEILPNGDIIIRRKRPLNPERTLPNCL